MPDTPVNNPNPAADPVALLLARLAEMAAPAPVEGLRAEQAAAFVGVSRSKWHEMNAAGQIPAPVQLGDGRLPVWSVTELRAWLLSGAAPRAKWVAMREQAIKRLG